MHTVLDTTALPACQGLAAWRSALLDVLQADCCIEPAPAGRFDARMVVSILGDWKMVQISGTPQTIRRRGPGAAGSVSVMCQIEGGCHLVQGCREALLQPGDLCIVPPDGDVVGARQGSFRQILLNVPQASLDQALPLWRDIACTTIRSDSPQVRATLDLARFAIEHGQYLPAAIRDQFAACGTALLGSLAPEDTTGRPRPSASRLATYQRQRVERFLQDNLRDPELSVGKIAGALGLSPRYLHKLYAGEPAPVMQQVLTHRLQRCRHEIASRGSRAICEVAYAWGFNSPAHFSRAFKKQFGVRPSDL